MYKINLADQICNDGKASNETNVSQRESSDK